MTLMPNPRLERAGRRLVVNERAGRPAGRSTAS